MFVQPQLQRKRSKVPLDQPNRGPQGDTKQVNGSRAYKSLEARRLPDVAEILASVRTVKSADILTSQVVVIPRVKRLHRQESQKSNDSICDRIICRSFIEEKANLATTKSVDTQKNDIKIEDPSDETKCRSGIESNDDRSSNKIGYHPQSRANSLWCELKNVVVTSRYPKRNLEFVSNFCLSFIKYQLETWRLLVDSASQTHLYLERENATNEPQTIIVPPEKPDLKMYRPIEHPLVWPHAIPTPAKRPPMLTQRSLPQCHPDSVPYLADGRQISSHCFECSGHLNLHSTADVKKANFSPVMVQLRQEPQYKPVLPAARHECHHCSRQRLARMHTVDPQYYSHEMCNLNMDDEFDVKYDSYGDMSVQNPVSWYLDESLENSMCSLDGEVNLIGSSQLQDSIRHQDERHSSTRSLKGSQTEASKNLARFSNRTMAMSSDSEIHSRGQVVISQMMKHKNLQGKVNEVSSSHRQKMNRFGILGQTLSEIQSMTTNSSLDDIRDASTSRSKSAATDREQVTSSNLKTNLAASSGVEMNQSDKKVEHHSSLKKMVVKSSKISLDGAKRRLGFKQRGLSSMVIHRSEEILPPDAIQRVRCGHYNSLSDSYNDATSLYSINSLSHSNQSSVLPLDPRVLFVDGLGLGQIASRQAIVSPYLGDIQLSLSDRRGMLEVEVVRARGLQPKFSSSRLPCPYVKVYLMKNRKCIAKFKTKQANQTLNPLYQQLFIFRDNDYADCLLQVIVWGDYGKRYRKALMGIVQIHLNDVDISSIVVGWYRLFNLPSMANCVMSSSKTLRQTISSTNLGLEALQVHSLDSSG